MTGDPRGIPCPITFGDEFSQRKWEASRLDLLTEARAKGWRWIVAPSCVVTTPSGRRLTAGQQVKLADFRGSPLGTPERAMLVHVQRGVVVDCGEPQPNAPGAA